MRVREGMNDVVCNCYFGMESTLWIDNGQADCYLTSPNRRLNWEVMVMASPICCCYQIIGSFSLFPLSSSKSHHLALITRLFALQNIVLI